VRPENQDDAEYHVPSQADLRAARGALFAVCDGIGGLSEGRLASRRAVRSFIRAYYATAAELPERMLRRAAAETNADLYRARLRSAGFGRMGTTLVAAAILPAALWVLNVGDSRAYIWRGGHLSQISRDHTPDPYRRLADRRIDRALGTDPDVTPDLFGPIALQAGDRVLLCSDGLTTAVADRTIAAVIGEFAPVEAARQLVERARTAGAQDNVTVLLVGLDAPPVQAPADGLLAGIRRGLDMLRQLVQKTWGAVNPWPMMASPDLRTRRGLAILVGWAAAALILGLVFGLLIGK
jgi:protein phosphatase